MSMNVNSQSITDANILTEPNFLDWLKNLRIVLKRERLAYVIVEPIPESTTVDALDSSTWIIDSRATDQMKGNSSLFTMFQSHPSSSNVTLSNGSTSCVLGTGTIHQTPLITLTSVLSLPQFSFNLISMSKLTRTLNCSISFFPDCCLIQDLSTKQIIDRGHESRGLYIIETNVSKYVVCSRVVTPFKLHCHLGHPFLFVEKAISSVF